MKRSFKKTVLLASTAALVSTGVLSWSGSASAQECFIGELRHFGGNFAPRSWALAQGQLLAISQNPALFSILGTTYGGDGRTTFGLPDLRGRVIVGAGSGPGLTTRRIGQKSGSERETLTVSQMPSHNHSVAPNAVSGQGNADTPTGRVPARVPRQALYSSAAPDVTMAATTSSNTGGSQAHNNMQPFLVMNPIICLVGIFPSRN